MDIPGRKNGQKNKPDDQRHGTQSELKDGRVELDTNLVENAIRPTAVGKKNWLFIGHKESGWKAAILYTLIGNGSLTAYRIPDAQGFYLRRLRA